MIVHRTVALRNPVDPTGECRLSITGRQLRRSAYGADDAGL